MDAKPVRLAVVGEDHPREAEVAVEIDPRTLTAEGVDCLASMGTNRASLGVQDFDPAVQDAIGRHQSLELTAACVAQLRAVGIGSLNLDLIYGLPHQTTEGVRRTIRQAIMTQAPAALILSPLLTGGKVVAR
jgi:oxygen-independent coproporphyrinogen-3 oxidase